MINSILTNLTSRYVTRNLNLAQTSVSLCAQRLSSGLKINNSKDGASDCIISSKMNVQLSGTNICLDNTNHGLNMLATADSILENMQNKVSRIRDLSLQAMNSTYSITERKVLQDEIDELCAEINREKETAFYGNKKIFTEEINAENVSRPYAYQVEYLESDGAQIIDTGYIPNENTEIYGKVAFENMGTGMQHMGCIANIDGLYSRWHFGVNDVLGVSRIADSKIPDLFITIDNEFHEYYLSNDVVGIDGNYAVSSNTKNSDITFALFARNGYTDANGTKGVVNYSKCKIESFQIKENSKLIHDYIPVMDYDNKPALYDKVTKTMHYNEGSGNFKVGDKIQEEEKKEISAITLQVGANAGNSNTIVFDSALSFEKLEVNVVSKENAKLGVEFCDDLLDKLSKKRSKFGAILNRLESAHELQNQNVVNLSETKSLIEDADIAYESSQFVRAQILQQVSSSLFSQANSINGNLAKRLLNIA